MHQDATPTDVLKSAIRRDERAVYRIARDAGVCPTILLRFMAGERGLNTATFDRLCRALNLGLAPGRRRAA